MIATTAALALALLLQTPPKAKPVPAPTVSAKRQAEIQRTIELKRQAKTKKKQQRATSALMKAYEATEAQKEAERLAPLIRAEQEHQVNVMQKAASAQAWQQLGQAAQTEAEISRRRYILETQRAGQAQIFDRSQGGFVPYGGSTARPYPR